MTNIDDSHKMLHYYLLIMIMMELKGDERAVSLNLLIIILIINLKRMES
jgi:hypothetical protein